MRVLLAFDKFKDSLTAREACDFAAAAVRERHRDWTLDLCPLADGGEGFCNILTTAAGGHMITTSVTDPLGDRVQAPIGVVPYERIPDAARAMLPPPPARPRTAPAVAVLEMASASGLALLDTDERDVWQTSSQGTGELIRTATELGAHAILLGVGGSATNDLGLGALAALGLQFLSGSGQRVNPPIPAHWREIERIQGSLTPPLPPLRIACDVTNPLLGSRGAAAVYGPQKGLRTADLPRIEQESARLGLMLCTHCQRPDTLMDTPGAGAAGGIAFGLMTAAGAELLGGFELVSAWLDLEKRIQAADIVITGEGRFDDSSLSGKGPGAVAARALAQGKIVHVFAGATRVTTPPARLHLHPISPASLPLDQALRQASTHLVNAVRAAF